MKWWMRTSVRWWGLIAYCILLPVGTLLIFSRSQSYPPSLVASRDLEANQLLVTGDVDPITAAPQYLTRSVKKGEPLRPGDVSTFPAFAVRANEVPVALPVKQNLMQKGVVNAGKKVHICKAGKAEFQDVPVRAVLCPPAGGDCIAFVVLPAGAGDIAKTFGAGNPPEIAPAQGALQCQW